MTVRTVLLPDGFRVRLHDDVEVDGDRLRRGDRLVRMSAVALRLLDGRELVAASGAPGALATQLLDLDLAVPVLAGPGALADVTVVIPVLDRADGVDRLLAALAPHVGCLVVDDGSVDAAAIADVVRRHGARLVRLERNAGPAVARNVGRLHVETPYVAFVDSDVELGPDVLRQLVAHLADPGLAAVAPRVLSRGGSRWFERYEQAAGGLDLGPVSATVRPSTFITYVPSACLVLRVRAFGAGFDPALRSGEDVDLVWRLQADGWRVRHAAEVEVGHDGRTSVRSWLGRTAFYGTSAAPLAQRHGDLVAPAVLLPTAAAAASGVLLQRRWSLVLATVLGLRAVQTAPAEPRAVVVATGRQVTRLALRTWWPAALVAAFASRRARRAVAVMALVDGLVHRRRSGSSLDPIRHVAARRADDLAYGAGVWWGAWKARSVQCLVPRWIRVGR